MKRASPAHQFSDRSGLSNPGFLTTDVRRFSCIFVYLVVPHPKALRGVTPQKAYVYVEKSRKSLKIIANPAKYLVERHLGRTRDR